MNQEIDSNIFLKEQSPSVLILGGSRGIGAACAQTFAEKYTVKTVSRNSGDLCGDLSNPQFRRQVVETFRPNIVIVTYGQWPSGETSLFSTLNLFMSSVVDFFELFEKKGGVEYFVVLSSLDAQATTHQFMGKGSFGYRIAKRLLSDFFTQAQLYMNYSTKIILVEPGMVMTDFADITNRYKANNPDDFLHSSKIKPMSPLEIAKFIFDTVLSNDKRSRTIVLHNSLRTL